MAEVSYLAAWITWLAQRRERRMSVRQRGGKTEHNYRDKQRHSEVVIVPSH